MPYKPMSPKEFEKYLKIVSWYLEKGKIDWNLYDENGHFICSVKISHGSRTKSEVTAVSVKKVKQAFEEKGFLWPPRKKSKKSSQ
jgi:hypothetical protein